MALFVLAKGFGMSKWRSKGRAYTPKHFPGPGNTLPLSPQPSTGRCGAGVVPDSLSILPGAFSQLPPNHQAAGSSSRRL